MFAWNVQPKVYLPGLVGAVNVAVPPSAVTFTSKAPWVVEVSVWFWLSWFLTVTFVPGATEGVTEYLKLLIVIMTACAAPGELDAAAGRDDDDDLWGTVPVAWDLDVVAEAPQPLSPTTSAAAAMVTSPVLMLIDFSYGGNPVVSGREVTFPGSFDPLGEARTCTRCLR